MDEQNESAEAVSSHTAEIRLGYNTQLSFWAQSVLSSCRSYSR